MGELFSYSYTDHEDYPACDHDIIDSDLKWFDRLKIGIWWRCWWEIWNSFLERRHSSFENSVSFKQGAVGTIYKISYALRIRFVMELLKIPQSKITDLFKA